MARAAYATVANREAEAPAPLQRLDILGVPYWTESYFVDLLRSSRVMEHILLKDPEDGVIGVLMPRKAFAKLEQAASLVTKNDAGTMPEATWATPHLRTQELPIEIAERLASSLAAPNEHGSSFIVETYREGVLGMLLSRSEYALLMAAAKLAADPDEYRALRDYKDSGKTREIAFG
jgi:hypothetical protein